MENVRTADNNSDHRGVNMKMKFNVVLHQATPTIDFHWLKKNYTILTHISMTGQNQCT